jgi:DNA-binding PadR family transcriptional regulator
MPVTSSFKDSGVVVAVLALLREHPRHGYELCKDLERLTQHRLAISPSTIYPQLTKMEKDGLIASEWSEGTGERKRKVYVLTAKGKKEATLQIRQWNRYARAMTRIIKAAEPEYAAAG